MNYTNSTASETYSCSIDYDPPLIFPTICILIGISFVILLCLDRIFKSPYFNDAPLYIRAYRYVMMIHTFWSAAQVAYTIGYQFSLFNGQPFTPYITVTSGTTQFYVALFGPSMILTCLWRKIIWLLL